MKMISVNNVYKSYKDKEVLKGVNFEIEKASIFALLGSNGAGKSTLIKILTTLLEADSGSVSIDGLDLKTDFKKIKQIISLTGQSTAVDLILTGRENMYMIARLRGVKDYKQKTDDLLARFNLSEAADKQTSTYSGGMLRKLDLAMSLLGQPKVIFLDEPTTGLDPQGRIEIWDMIRKFRDTGTTILLTTQYLEEAEQLADRVAILDEGYIKQEGSSKELKALITIRRLTLVFNDEHNFNSALKLYPNSEHDISTLTIILELENNLENITEVLTNLTSNNIELAEFSQEQPSLEDVFFKIVNGSNK